MNRTYLDQPYGRNEPINPDRSVRACMGGECEWKWEAVTDNDERPLAIGELEAFLKFLPSEQMKKLALAQMQNAINEAARGALLYEEASMPDSSRRIGSPAVGPVKRIYRTLGVFEISTERCDFDGSGPRCNRIYFTEPKDDADLLLLKFGSKPEGIEGLVIQDKDCEQAQDRYDCWVTKK